MTNTYTFNYTFKNKSKTKVIIANSYAKAIESAELFLEGLDDDLDLLGYEYWEDVQDECEKYDIIVGDLTEDFE